MAKFELSYNGQKYEVEAPDEASALSAFQSQIVGGDPSSEQRYNSALETVRQSQFADMTPEQWTDYSSTILAPQGFQGIAQQGQLFGLSDEIGAGIGAFGSQVRNWMGDESAPGFGEAYGQYSELEQARRDLGRENLGAPLSVAAELIGGTSIFAPAAAGVNAALAPSRMKSVGTGAAAGALMGGLYGFGSADENRGQSALIGAGVGGVAGAAAPYIADAASAGYQSVANALSRRAAAQQAGMSPEAMGVLRQVVEPDMAAYGNQGINSAGSEAMMLDMGPNTQMAADYLMRKPGGGAAIIGEALGDRAARDANVLQDTLNLYLGDPQGVATMRRNIATSTEPQRQAAYEAAYSAPIDYSGEAGRRLESLLGRVDQADLNAANNLMRAEGFQSNQIMAQIDDAGNIVYTRQPDVRQIDYLTRALNDRSQANAGLGAMGGQTNQGRIYGNLASEIRSATRQAVPEYATALETAADPISRSRATQLGYDMLNPNFTRDQAQIQMSGMSGPEREAVALGIRSKLDDAVSNVGRAVTTGRSDEVTQALKAMQDLTKPSVRTKVSLAIGDADASLLFEEVDRIFQSFQREALRRTGSQTAGRLFMDEAFSPISDPTDPLSALGRGKPLNAGQRGIQALTGMTDDRLAARGQQAGSQIAQALVSQGPEMQNTLQAIARYNANFGRNQSIAEALSQRLGQGSGLLPYPAAMLERNRQR